MNRTTFRNMAYHVLAVAAFLGLAACQNESPGEGQLLEEVRKNQQAILEEIKDVKITMKSMARRGLTVNIDRDRPKPSGKGRFDLSQSPRRGPADASVVVVEFADFECPFCKKAAGFGKKLVEEYPEDVAVVFKHFPLHRHENAKFAARASWAAGRQGKFWEFHDAVFAAPGISKEQVRAVAEAIGLDMARFDADVASPLSLAAVQKDRLEGKENEIRGTPAFFVNGQQVRPDPVTIRGRVTRALEAAKRQAEPSGAPAPPAAAPPA